MAKKRIILDTDKQTAEKPVPTRQRRKPTVKVVEAAQVAEPLPAQRPVSRRESGGLQLNWKWIGITVGIIIGLFILNSIFNNGKGTTQVAPPTEQGQVESVTTETSVTCAPIAGMSENRGFTLSENVPFQESPEMNSRAILGSQALMDTVYYATGRYACDRDGNYWIETVQRFSDGNRNGWVNIASNQRSWFYWSGEAPAPVSTEEVNSGDNGSNQQSMRSIRVGSGSCTPNLQPADFYDANHDSDQVWSGYWIRSNDRAGMVNVRSSANLNGTLIARLEVNGVVEVISHSDGFHFACADGMVWWNVRFYGDTQTVEGWMAEGDSEGMFVEGYR